MYCEQVVCTCIQFAWRYIWLSCVSGKGQSEDVEWLDEDEVDTAGLLVPDDTAPHSGLPTVDSYALPWE